VAVTAGWLAGTACAQDAGEGQDLAQKLCASCHATDPAGKDVTRPDVPTFRSIANSPRTSPDRLAAAIILPHPAMPGIALTRDEIRAVISYILSLKRE
jgi:mono/diheme cytochrome c family protein